MKIIIKMIDKRIKIPITLPVLCFLKIMFPNMKMEDSVNKPRMLKIVRNVGDKLLTNIGHVSSTNF